MGGEVGGDPSLAQGGGVGPSRSNRSHSATRSARWGARVSSARTLRPRRREGQRRRSLPDLRAPGRGPRGPGTTLGGGDPRPLPDPWSTPPPSWPGASTAPATGCTWWVARCATPSPTTPPLAGAARLRPHHRRRARRDRAAGGGLGRRRVAPGQALRHGRAPPRRADVIEITTHRAEAYTPDSRKPEVAFGDSIEADLSRRDFTVNAMALRLSRLRARRSLRRPGRSRRRAACAPRSPPKCPSPTIRCGCCGRRGSSPVSAWSPTRPSCPP